MSSTGASNCQRAASGAEEGRARVLRERVVEGVTKLHSAGLRPHFVIIDDGWQTVVTDGTDSIGEVEAAGIV